MERVQDLNLWKAEVEGIMGREKSQKPGSVQSLKGKNLIFVI